MANPKLNVELTIRESEARQFAERIQVASPFTPLGVVSTVQAHVSIIEHMRVTSIPRMDNQFPLATDDTGESADG